MSIENKYDFKPLPEPILITEQEWPEGTLSLVDTRTMTFNHENYIRDCIEGLLKQKTTFPVQVMIHDDASTDKTAEIVREYQLKYPKLIKSYCQKENSHTKLDKDKRRQEFMSWRVGKYDALCEGDDYWTDPLKLQKQVDFLEAHEDCAVVFHAAEHFNENTGFKKIHKPKDAEKRNRYFMSEAILGGGGFMTTNSVMYRRALVMERPDWALKSPIGDVVLMLLLAIKGNIGYINDVMSTYRVMTPGSWTSSTQTLEKKRIHHKKMLQVWLAFNKHTHYKHFFYVVLKIGINYSNLLKFQIKNKLKK